jgi:hypothetical protein
MTGKKSDNSIIASLVKGTVTFNNAEEYIKILKEFPDDPRLNRLFGDFLKKRKSFIDANLEYRKAFRLFMETGDPLQAITSILHGWEIVSPTTHDFRYLHSQLRRKNFHNSAVAECFAKMSYKELKAFVTKLKPVQFADGEIVQEVAAPEDALYFVISGELIRVLPEGENYAGQEMVIRENDQFGDIYPCEEKKSVVTRVKCQSDVELLKITKTDLLTLCGEYPDLENGITRFTFYQSLPEKEKPAKFFRKTSRRHLSVMLGLEIFEDEPGRQPISVKGFTSDISLGGVCIIVDPRYRDIPVEDIINRKTKIRISLPDEIISLIILGRMAWYKETEIDGQPTYALGVQFEEMPPKLRGLLIIFANAVGTMTKQLETIEISQDILDKKA